MTDVIDTAKNRPPGVIEPGVIYTLDEFKARTGLSKHALRTARGRGLTVLRIGNRGYVSGDDAIAYFLEHGRQDGPAVKHAPQAASQTPIEVLGLSCRVLNALEHGGHKCDPIDTVEQLLKTHPKRLLNLNNFGNVCFSQTLEAVKKYGIELPPAWLLELQRMEVLSSGGQ